MIKATVVVQVVMRGVAATALPRVGGAALLASTSSISSTCAVQFYFYLQSPSLPFLAHLLHFFLIDDPNCLLPATFVSWPLSVPPLV